MKRSKPVAVIPATPVTSIEATAYWQLRTRLQEHAAISLETRKAVYATDQALNAAFIAAGLDPAKVYRLTDDGCMAELQQP